MKRHVMSSRIKWSCTYFAILTAVVLAAETPLASSVSQVPEIGGGSISAGLGLLAAGILMLRARRSK